MAFAILPEQTLTDIASAIRSKTGSSDLLYPSEMAQEISEIQTGITPTGTLKITSNGTYDVAQYANANVCVNKIKALIDITHSAKYLFATPTNSITTASATINDVVPLLKYNTTENAESFEYMFWYQKELTAVPLFDISKATSLRSMFHNCQKLIEIPAYNCTNITDLTSVFNNCTSLTRVHMTNIGVSLDLSSATLYMDHDACMEVIGNLSTVTTTQTLKLYRTSYDSLSSDEIALATAKGWTVTRS